MSSRGAALLLISILGLAALPAAGADHIRAMTVYQSSNVGNQVTLRVDYQPSGNPWGGAFFWNTGDGRTGGGIPDGIENGCWVGPDSEADVPFAPGPTTYSWTRYEVFPNLLNPCAPLLVRIEITYSYAVAPWVYAVNWYDCCPASGLVTPVVVSGVEAESAPISKILAFDTSDNVELSLLAAGFEPCWMGPSAPVCYDLVDPADFASWITFPASELNEYKVMYVGSEAQAATTALVARSADVTNPNPNDVLNWISGGGGVVVYGQTQGSWLWLPQGNQIDAVSSAGDDVFLTLKGQGHSSHLNQLPADASLGGWGPSKVNVFTGWPAYFDDVLGGPLSTDGRQRAVSLAGVYGGVAVHGCVFISGQPVDGRAVAGVFYASTLVRSSIHYALTCDATPFVPF